MSEKFIFVHGINQPHPDYALALIQAMDLSSPECVCLQWANFVFHDLIDYQVTNRPKRFWWSFVPLLRQLSKLVKLMHESAVWVRAYEDPDQQASILEYACAEIESAAAEGHTLTLIGHSLGTIVLVDAVQRLLATGRINETSIDTIVTMGSPLHAWKAPRKLAGILRNIPCRRWLNLIDCYDFIAGHLGRIDARIEDVTVKNGGWWNRIFPSPSAHDGYWENRAIARMIQGKGTG